MAENVVLDVTSDEWEEEVLSSDAPVAVDFWHENCTWCNRLDPLYQQMAKDYQGKTRFARLHVFREKEIATRYGITGTPTIKFFCAGREVNEIVGYRPPDVLRQEFDKVVASYKECLSSSTPLKRGRGNQGRVREARDGEGTSRRAPPSLSMRGMRICLPHQVRGGGL